MQQGLDDYPDQELACRLVDHAKNGVPIGYTGPRHPREHPNWPSAFKHHEAVTASIVKDVARGRKLVFDHPPYPNFVGSPMGCFQRKSSSKYRVIHDLSWPPGESINDFISHEDYTLHYISVDDIVQYLSQFEPGAQMAKLDLEDAFKHIPVRPEDWELLGTTWYTMDDNGNKRKIYLVDLVLPFGMRSSPKLFDDFATALEYIMCKNGATYVNHYLDDYITVGPPASDMCQRNLDIMLDTCKYVNFSVNPAKVVGPSTTLEFLGIVIDTINLELRISEERLADTMCELREWEYKLHCTKRELLSLIGKLTFLSRVVTSGRSFVRRMIELSKQAAHLHYKLTLDSEFREDLRWWLAYLPKWNGVSLFKDQYWSSNINLHLFTDASNLGIGAYFRGAWFLEPFMGENAKHATRSINWREMYALVKAAAVWGKDLANKKVLFHSDNMTVVSVLQSGTSKNGELMKLVRGLFYICAKNNFECSATYISTKENSVADALSRLDMVRFRSLVPNADAYMTIPCDLEFI